MEASAFPAPSGLARARISVGAPLLRLRSDEQLVALFRDGHDEAFRVIHDRYRQRLFAYTRQMLPGSRQDAEDALQDVFVRAYGALRADHRSLALRAWLYRVAHNRCIDELRRPIPPSPEVLELVRPPSSDPIAEAEQRESLRRLIADVRRLPDQQRSALLMRELAGMSYAEVSDALGVSIPAVKSLLVRARVGLAQAAEARETSCIEIRDDLILAHDRGVRPSGLARRHLRDCNSCRQFRTELRGASRQFAALLPALGPAGILAKLLGFGGGGGAAASGSAAASGGAAAVGTGGTVASVGVIATGAGHVATLLAAAVVTAGGAVEIQGTIARPVRHRPHHARPIALRPAPPAPTVSSTASYVAAAPAPTQVAAPQPAVATKPRHPARGPKQQVGPLPGSSASGTTQGTGTTGLPWTTATGDPTIPGTAAGTTDGTSTGGATPTATGTDPASGGATAGTGTSNPNDPGTTQTGTNGAQGSTTGTTSPTDTTTGSGGSTGTGGTQVTG